MRRAQRSSRRTVQVDRSCRRRRFWVLGVDRRRGPLVACGRTTFDAGRDHASGHRRDPPEPTWRSSKPRRARPAKSTWLPGRAADVSHASADGQVGHHPVVVVRVGVVPADADGVKEHVPPGGEGHRRRAHPAGGSGDGVAVPKPSERATAGSRFELLSLVNSALTSCCAGRVSRSARHRPPWPARRAPLGDGPGTSIPTAHLDFTTIPT